MTSQLNVIKLLVDDYIIGCYHITNAFLCVRNEAKNRVSDFGLAAYVCFGYASHIQ